MAMPLAFEHKSSIETKIAPRLVRIAVGSDPGSTDMGRLQREWFSNLTLPESRSLSTPMGSLRRYCGGALPGARRVRIGGMIIKGMGEGHESRRALPLWLHHLRG